MVISIHQMSRVHNLEQKVLLINANGNVLERVTLRAFPLGVWIQENLKWTEHVIKTVSSCFAAPSTLKKFRNIAPKQEETIGRGIGTIQPSKVDYNDIVVYPREISELHL